MAPGLVRGLFPWDRRARADLLAVLVLLLTGAAIGWPIFTGGYRTYLDQPAHLAEIFSLAGEASRGWSDIAFCGFPLGNLHSPVWYGLLTGWATAHAPLGFLYCLLVWIAFCAPALALFAVLRPRAGTFPSALLSYLLLIQRSAIVGTSSAFGGMWTFALGAAGLILLADRLSRPSRDLRQTLLISLLMAGIFLTHAIVSLTSLVLLAIHIFWSLVRRTPRRVVLLDLSALAGAGVLSAVYWVPNVLARGFFHFQPWDLSPIQLTQLLVLPLDVQDILIETGESATSILYTDALPLMLLLTAGLLGALQRRRRSALSAPGDQPAGPFGRTSGGALRGSHRNRAISGFSRFGIHDPDPLPLYGISLTLVLATLLFLVQPLTGKNLLGPISWRQLYFVRVGLAFSALPLLSHPFVGWPIRVPRGLALSLAGAAVLSGLWWGTPLRREVQSLTGTDMREVHALWGWLSANRGPSWGRVYLQDTFMTQPRESRLSNSHILALTSHETGVRQIGAFYGAVPYVTSRWTNGLLYPGTVRDATALGYLLGGLNSANCTHVVASEAVVIQELTGRYPFQLLYRSERFGVFALQYAHSNWSQSLTPVIECGGQGEEHRPGEIFVPFEAERAGASLLVKESYHPWWKALEPPGVRLLATESGLMQVNDFPAGKGRLHLRWDPPRWPGWITAAGVLGWIVLWAGLGLARRRTP